ncbi:MAG: DNA polymerase III subunit beta [Patescibacteria group bacterium]|nr:DNA polymerase III subunit beta [Patescibacteria group bacterium]
MKILCTQENLNKGLTAVSKLAIPNINLPILSNILLETKNGRLRLASTNLETGINYFVRGKVVSQGSITVASSLITNYINSLPVNKVTLKVENDNLNIKTASDKAVMRGLPASDFPFQYALVSKMKKGIMFSVKERDLRFGLLEVSFATTQDELRPEIAGVFFNFGKQDLTLVATDSYRLAEKCIKFEQMNKEAAKAIIPLKAIQELVHILEDSEEIVKIFFVENQVLFQFREIDFTARLVEGQYPDYKQIIPQRLLCKAKVKTRDFAQAVRRASFFTARETNDIRVKLDPKSNEILISAESAGIGTNESRVEAEVRGEPQEIVYNHRYFLEGLNNLPSEETIFETNGPDEPGILRPVDPDGMPAGQAGSFLYLIMPIRN